MDFSNFPPYTGVSHLDYSPGFDEAYLPADTYATSPDSLSNFFDCDTYFNQPFDTTSSAALSLPPQAAPGQHLPGAPAPFGQLRYFPAGAGPSSAAFSFDALDSTPSPPQSSHSRTSSLSDSDGESHHQTHSHTHPPSLPLSQLPNTPPLSPNAATATMTTSPLADQQALTSNTTSSNTTSSTTEKPPTPLLPRKRGRPRLSQSIPRNSASPPHTRTCRVSHNEVERKYRENLNAEMERLRHAIPTLPQSEDGQPKPSKAMVLAGAIEYIARIERERDMYRDECMRLRGL